jgi:hypothetical protein
LREYLDRHAPDKVTKSMDQAIMEIGEGREAEEEMEAAQQLGNESQNRFLPLQFELASGRVLFASVLKRHMRCFST